MRAIGAPELSALAELMALLTIELSSINRLLDEVMLQRLEGTFRARVRNRGHDALSAT